MLDVETFREGFQILPPSSCYIKMGRHGGRRLAPIHYRLVTFAACRPLGPEVTSNSTAWPSFSDLYPSAWMAEKWTKMSSPDWRWMNPNPLLALNHFTVPCSFTVFPFHYFELFGASRPPPAVQQKRSSKCVTCSPFNR